MRAIQTHQPGHRRGTVRQALSRHHACGQCLIQCQLGQVACQQIHWQQADITGNALPTNLASTCVNVGNTRAYLRYVSPTQINAQVPWNVTLGSVAVRVQRGFLEIPSQSFTLTAVSPGIFTTNQTGSGPAAILHAATFEAVTPANPAVPGERLAIFATGLGAVRPAVASGAPAPSPAPTTISSALVNIGGIPAAIEFSGLAPGFVGLYQVNVIVPGGLASGNQDVQLVINGTPSNTVTLAIR